MLAGRKFLKLIAETAPHGSTGSAGLGMLRAVPPRPTRHRRGEKPYVRCRDGLRERRGFSVRVVVSLLHGRRRTAPLARQGPGLHRARRRLAVVRDARDTSRADSRDRVCADDAIVACTDRRAYRFLAARARQRWHRACIRPRVRSWPRRRAKSREHASRRPEATGARISALGGAWSARRATRRGLVRSRAAVAFRSTRKQFRGRRRGGARILPRERSAQSASARQAARQREEAQGGRAAPPAGYRLSSIVVV